MSTFTCPVVQIPGHGKHRNADTLRITQVDGCVCIFKEGDFQTGELAVLIPVDAMVPVEHSAFAFLKDKQKPNQTHVRIKARRLRGVFSDGLLLPVWALRPGGSAPLGSSETIAYDRSIGDEAAIQVGTKLWDGFEVKLGQDVSERLGVTKAEDVAPAHMGGEQERGPDVPVYDIEPWKKFKGVFEDPAEVVVVTEKLHGTNSRFQFGDGRLWVGSRNRFLREDERNLWWRIAARYGLAEKLAKYPGLVLYGETYGDVQDLKYGQASGDRVFASFDLYNTKTKSYLDYVAFKAICFELDIPTVPELYLGPIGDGSVIDQLTNPAEGEKGFTSTIDGKTLREGVVVKPVVERWNHNTHRTILKHVSHAYLLRKGGTECH
jgi:RNA ligase (TIGR02306 family)